MSKARDLILKTIRETSCLKQDVFSTTAEQFQLFKSALRGIIEDLEKDVTANDQRVTFKYEDKGEYGAMIKFAGDVLIFQMHTNVFNFDKSHHLWKTGYLQEDETRAYCGMINVYNFLADSFKYNRINDSGYLVARVFVNKEKHFFVEGKRQLGFLYNDFVNGVIDADTVTAIVESAILFALDFDLLTPPYDAMKETSMGSLMEMQRELRIKTGKRLGFRFHADDDIVA